ncbi:MAG: ABC transporter permease [Vicinamibacterales bacterium]
MAQLLADVREMLVEQVRYRSLLRQLARRDLLVRYKQTAIGLAWAVFMPLVNTVVFSIVFMRLAPIATPVPYPVFAYCGLFAWNFFAASLKASVSSLTGNAGLVTKVYFPREIFPFSVVLVSLVDFAVASVVLGGLMAYFRVGVSASVFLLPAVLVVHVAFTAGVALLLAMGNLFYRDVRYIFDVVITVWMFVSSVLYPVDLLEGWTGRLMLLNPITPIIDGYRRTILYGQSPFTPAFAFASIVAFTVLAVAWVSFHRAEFEFAESI